MVLEAVTDVDNPPRTIDALAARVGLTRSNTHRTLQTLIHAGYVIKDDEGGGYRGAVRLFELAARQLAQLDVRKLAAPTCARWPTRPAKPCICRCWTALTWCTWTRSTVRSRSAPIP